MSALLKSRQLIKKIKPDICVSFGGYVSVPVIIASFLAKIPSVTHEQTSTLSLSTKINSLFSDFTALSFPQKHYSPKQIFTGNLIRPEIFKQKSKLFQSLKISKPIIYVTAGNQGSHDINLLIPGLSKICNQFYFIHQTGALEFENFNKLKLKNYHPIDYIDSENIGWVLNNSRLIISRSGANTCQEIVALNKPSILIPLPSSQQNEQLKNALWVKQNLPKHTMILKQKQYKLKNIQSMIDKLVQIPHLQKTRSINNNPKLLTLCHEILT